MPSNKEALLRYRAINRCLIDYRVATKENLIDACTEAVGTYVSWRTIAGDIKAMRQDDQLGYHAPIKNIKNEGYCYTDRSYSIDQIPLRQEELTAISFAANLLKQYAKVDLFSTFSGAVEKLSEKVELHVRENDTTQLADVISFEKSTTDGGSRFINELLQHIRQKTVISIEYHSFSSNTTKAHVMHPYYLKEYRNRWYLMGHHETYGEVRTLALERILSITPDYYVEYQPANFNVHNYYEDAIGVTITKEPPIAVRFRVPLSEYQYLQSQPIHASQKLVEKGDAWAELEVTAINNFELRSTILALGSSVEIIAPTSLRNFMFEEGKKISKNNSI